jgi:hypothetical protein
MVDLKKKMMYSLGCNLITFYLTGLSNIWTHEQAIKNKNLHPLQDQGFKLISYNQDYLFVNDYILIGIVIMSLGLVLIHKKRVEIIFRWSLMLNILFSMRIITIPSTILTRPIELDEEWSSCKTIDYDYNGLWGPFEMILQNKMTCFDFIFSGHMINTITCVLLVIKYVKWKYIHLLWIVVIAESFCIIVIRAHYLIDIEIAFLLTTLVWIVLEYRERLIILTDILLDHEEEKQSFA